jgi:DUF4097 and DUF4098 domain-containing protein YvlB
VDGRELGGDLVVGTVSGDVTVAHTGESLRLGTVSGDIEARAAARTIELETVSGRVRLDNGAAVSRGRVSSVSGDLELTTAVAAEGDLALESVSGAVTLALRGAVDARVALDAGPGGSIENRLGGEELDRSSHGPTESLALRLGSGRADIDVGTLSGRIELSAAPGP